MKFKDSDVDMLKREMAFEEALCLSNSKSLRGNFKKNVDKDAFMFFLNRCDGNYPVLDMELQKHYLNEEDFNVFVKNYYIEIIEKMKGGKTVKKLVKGKDVKIDPLLLNSYYKKPLSLMYFNNEMIEEILISTMILHTDLAPERFKFMTSLWKAFSFSFDKKLKYRLEDAEIDIFKNYQKNFLDVIVSEKFIEHYEKSDYHKQKRHSIEPIIDYLSFVKLSKGKKQLNLLTTKLLKQYFDTLAEIVSDNPNSTIMNYFNTIFEKALDVGVIEVFKKTLFESDLKGCCLSIPISREEQELFFSIFKIKELEENNIEIRVGNNGYCKAGKSTGNNSMAIHPMDYFKIQITYPNELPLLNQ